MKGSVNRYEYSRGHLFPVSKSFLCTVYPRKIAFYDDSQALSMTSITVLIVSMYLLLDHWFWPKSTNCSEILVFINPPGWPTITHNMDFLKAIYVTNNPGFLCQNFALRSCRLSLTRSLHSTVEILSVERRTSGIFICKLRAPRKISK